MKKICAFIIISFAAFTTVPKCEAVSFQNTLVAMPGFTPGISYDGPEFNILAAVASFVSPVFYEAVGPFSGRAGGGSIIEFVSLGGATHYDDQHDRGVDTLGVLGAGGAFTPILSNAIIGATNTFFADENEEYAFAMQTPLSIVDSRRLNNPEDELHFFFMIADENFVGLLANLSLNDPAPYLANIRIGDILAFVNDRPSLTCNDGNCGDYDFNDFVGVIRETPVPEPTSLVLGSLGMGAALLRRRRAVRA